MNSNRFSFYAKKTSDAKSLGKMIDKFPVKTFLYGDNIGTYYRQEDIALERECILLKIQLKLRAK